MAHNFRPGAVGLEAYPVKLFALIAIGAAGAPTLSRAKGISSVARNSAGDYTLTLDMAYQKLLGFKGGVLNATGIPTTPAIGIKADNSNSATPTVEFVCSAATNSSTTTLVATDPANGDSLYLELTLSNSTVV